jgi:hypothetical protein
MRGGKAWGLRSFAPPKRGYHEFASDAQIDNIESQDAHVALGFRVVERSVLYLKEL